MRVIAGKYRSRSLAAPEGTTITRPTADRVRESLFNIITPWTPEATVLDLFSGSGALGIEALSRGAKKVVFVENHPEALSALRANLTKMGITSRDATVISCDVSSFLSPLKRKNLRGWREEEFAGSVDLVIADPPYASSWYHEAMEDLEKSGLCREETLVVLEMSSKKPAEVAATPQWELFDERIYGAARLEFWRRAEHTDDACSPENLP